MSLEAIEALIREKVGLDPRIIGSKNLSRAVNSRLGNYGDRNLTSYLQRLQTSGEEFKQLLELLLIPETWFFRDRQPFEFLTHYAQSHWLNNLKYSTVRGLSIPCSTGEEPYSIAISLLEAGLSPYQLKIEAIDLSEKAIAKAKQGVYGKNSFRGEFPIDRRRYFESTPAGEKINTLVQQVVNFRQGNILRVALETQNKYNFIFCRNLLIYLDPVASSQVMRMFELNLQGEGLLFVGASETAQISGNQWESIRKPFTFAYRKVSSPLPKISPTQTKIKKLKIAPERRVLSSPPPPPTKPPDPPRLESQLAIARKLGDKGEIEAAIRECSQYLEKNPTSAEGYSLLGTLYQSKGENRQAEQYFSRALYLNPNFYDQAPRTKEEEKIYTKLQENWEKWEQNHNEFLRLNEEYERIGIFRPYQLEVALIRQGKEKSPEMVRVRQAQAVLERLYSLEKENRSSFEAGTASLLENIEYNTNFAKNATEAAAKDVNIAKTWSIIGLLIGPVTAYFG